MSFLNHCHSKSYIIKFRSFLRENFDLQLFEFQNGIPIKSEKSFLYDYWNIFFQIYSIKMIEKFRQNIFETDFLSINNVFFYRIVHYKYIYLLMII